MEISKHSWKYEPFTFESLVGNILLKPQFWWFLQCQYIFNYDNCLKITYPKHRVFLWAGDTYTFLWVSISTHINNGTVKIPISAEIGVFVQRSTSTIWKSPFHQAHIWRVNTGYMVLGTGGYRPVVPSYHEGLLDVLMLVVYHTTQGMHPVPCNIMLFLAKDLKDDAGWHTWKMVLVILFRVNNFLQSYQKYVWYQNGISLVEHRLFSSFQFWEKGSKKLKNLIWSNRNSGHNWENKEEIRESTPPMQNKWCHWGGNSFSVCIVGLTYSTYFIFKIYIAMD